MAGHEILDSCHNCGKKGVHLNLVRVSNDGECEENKDYHHIHVFVACDRCKKEIWDKKD